MLCVCVLVFVRDAHILLCRNQGINSCAFILNPIAPTYGLSHYLSVLFELGWLDSNLLGLTWLWNSCWCYRNTFYFDTLLLYLDDASWVSGLTHRFISAFFILLVDWELFIMYIDHVHVSHPIPFRFNPLSSLLNTVSSLFKCNLGYPYTLGNVAFSGSMDM